MVLPLDAVANAPLRVAVASNFSDTAKQLVKAYVSYGYQPPQLLFGSTGKHAAQINNGLRVDLLLAADIDRPTMLENAGIGIYDSRVSYALGKLVLWVSDKTQNERSVRSTEAGASALDSVSNSPLEPEQTKLVANALSAASIISIANPSLAPYGFASKNILSDLTGLKRGEFKLVFGENVSQVLHFVNSGSVDAAFMPLSMVGAVQSGTIIKIPSGWHKPIEQQMLLISEVPEARRFYDFILSAEGRYIIQNRGYELPNG